jgi:hypothetical protein
MRPVDLCVLWFKNSTSIHYNGTCIAAAREDRSSEKCSRRQKIIDWEFCETYIGRLKGGDKRHGNEESEEVV